MTIDLDGSAAQTEGPINAGLAQAISAVRVAFKLLIHPGRLRQDVRDGYVTLAGAERDYGVVLDPETLAVRELRRPRRPRPAP
jgi:N-methylhydantoinase B/oxoprolinase/acetone carboxylase alpha subunit